MKFFVSGSIRHKEEIRSLYAQVEAAGHEITHDWTRSDPIGVKSENTQESGRRAKMDIDGVLAADVYVLDSSNTHVGKLMYGELVAAIVGHEHFNQPKHVFIIGPFNHDSIVYYHEAVTRVDSMDDVLDAVAR